ncbi:MAG: histidine kinase dimerization/phosphoacceptor domain -containing protein, partial [Pseudomonadota bacterium]
MRSQLAVTEGTDSEAVDAAKLLLGASPSPMLLFAPDLTLLFANEAHASMTGRPVSEIVGKGLFEAFPPNPDAEDGSAEEAIRAVVDRIVTSQQADEPFEQQHDVPSPTGEYERRFWSMVHWPIIANGQVVAILQRSEDVTSQVRQRRLIAAEKKAAEQSSGLSFFSFDPETDLFERSPGVDAMFGFANGEAGEHAAPFFARVHPDDLPSLNDEVERSIREGEGGMAAFDYRIILPESGDCRFVRVRAGVERDFIDGALKLFGTFVDMTDIENSRAELQQLSDRNAELVMESNHRIKNSLAIASAMLAQQLRATENETVRTALQVAATRIAAIADVHGELFKDSGIEWVDAGAMIRQFTSSFLKTVSIGEDKCAIACDAQSLQLPSRYA